MSPTKSNCEKCGAVFESTGEVTSTKLLCPACAAERRAQMKAAKAQAGAPTPVRATAAAAAAPRTHAPARAQATVPSTTSRTTEARAARRRARGEEEQDEHHVDAHKLHEADDKRMAKIGWMAVGGLTLVTLLVLVFVMNSHNSKVAEEQEYQKGLKDFVARLEQVNLNNEAAVKAGLELINANRSVDVTNRNTGWNGTTIQDKVLGKKSQFNGALQGLIQTRNLTAKLDDIQAKLAASPDVGVLSQQFIAVRDAELANEAKLAGGEYATRYDRVTREVSDRYLQKLREAVATAASATTAEGLAPYGLYEDALHVQFQEAMAAVDADAIARSKAELAKIKTEINGIVLKLFDEAYLNKAVNIPLLGVGKSEGWLVSPSPTFKHNVTSIMTMTNEAGEGGTGALTYGPGKEWRDYVLSMEVKLDSGTMGVYTRVGAGDKLDSKLVPAFTIGTIVGQKSPNVVIEYSKTYKMTVSTIGNQIVVFVDGSPLWNDDHIPQSKSRKGSPAFTCQAGTSITITKLEAKLLR